MDPVTILSHLIGPGSIKGGLKVANHIAGDGRFDGAISELTKFTESPAWTKHRIDSAMDTWDDHKDDIAEFFDNVGDTISETASTIADNAGSFLEGAADFIGGFFD